MACWLLYYINMKTRQQVEELASESARNIINGNITDAVFNIVEAGTDGECIVDEEKAFAVAYAAILAFVNLKGGDNKQTLINALARRAF